MMSDIIMNPSSFGIQSFGGVEAADTFENVLRSPPASISESPYPLQRNDSYGNIDVVPPNHPNNKPNVMVLGISPSNSFGEYISGHDENISISKEKYIETQDLVSDS